MTQPQPFFAPLSYKANREINLKMKESLTGAVILSTLLAGCAGDSTDSPPPTTVDQTTSIDTTLSDVPTSEAMESSEAAVLPPASSAAMMQTSKAARTRSSAAAMMQPSSAAAMRPEADLAPLQQQKYADGTFSAAGIYRSPAGGEEIHVSLTLKSGIIATATYEGTATQPKSKSMQEAFGEGYKQLVIGKSIDALSLDVVNGSSLTPMGFMDAVKKIQAEASAS